MKTIADLKNAIIAANNGKILVNELTGSVKDYTGYFNDTDAYRAMCAKEKNKTYDAVSPNIIEFDSDQLPEFYNKLQGNCYHTIFTCHTRYGGQHMRNADFTEVFAKNLNCINNPEIEIDKENKIIILHHPFCKKGKNGKYWHQSVYKNGPDFFKYHCKVHKVPLMKEGPDFLKKALYASWDGWTWRVNKKVNKLVKAGWKFLIRYSDDVVADPKEIFPKYRIDPKLEHNFGYAYHITDSLVISVLSNKFDGEKYSRIEIQLYKLKNPMIYVDDAEDGGFNNCNQFLKLTDEDIRMFDNTDISFMTEDMFADLIN